MARPSSRHLLTLAFLPAALIMLLRFLGLNPVVSQMAALASGLALLVGFGLLAVREINMKRWPRTTGVVLKAIREPADDEGQVVVRDYRYQVNAQTYAGRERSAPQSKRDAERLIQQATAGSPVEVYYQPAEPGISTLTPGFQTITYFLLVFGLLYLSLTFWQ